MPLSLSTLLGRSTTLPAISKGRIVFTPGSAFPRRSRSFIEISPSYFQQLREYAIDFRNDAEKVRWAIDRSVMGYAAITLGFAQQRSRGPLDPRQLNPQLAWKIPVRRIKGYYLMGWKMRRVSLGIWETYNDSREAYYIEYGINHEGTGLQSPSGGARVRVRRPVLKLSVMDAVEFARSSDMAWREFLGAFTFSSYSSPITNMSEAAVAVTLKSNLGRLTTGAINATGS